MDSIVTLNVSGRIFQTKRSTLKKSAYFNSIDDDEIFIDDDPDIFKHVLNLLRFKYYNVPSDDLVNVEYALKRYNIEMFLIKDNFYQGIKLFKHQKHIRSNDAIQSILVIDLDKLYSIQNIQVEGALYTTHLYFEFVDQFGEILDELKMSENKQPSISEIIALNSYIDKFQKINKKCNLKISYRSGNVGKIIIKFNMMI